MSFHPKMAYGATFHKSSRQLEDEGPVFVYTPENRARFDVIIRRYPPDRKRSAVLPALYLARPNQLGRVTVTTLDVADARARVVVMRAAAAPRYVEDNLDALPWHSGQAVIETIDQAVYDSSVSAGVITISIADRARAFYYGSAFVNSAVWRETFERAGYVLVRTLPGDVAYYRRPTT